MVKVVAKIVFGEVERDLESRMVGGEVWRAHECDSELGPEQESVKERILK